MLLSGLLVLLRYRDQTDQNDSLVVLCIIAPVRTTAHATSDPPFVRLQTSSGVDLGDLLIFLFFFLRISSRLMVESCVSPVVGWSHFHVALFSLLARMVSRATKSEIACRALTHATSACRALRYESAVIRSLQNRRHRDVLLLSITQLHEPVVTPMASCLCLLLMMSS